MRRNKGSGWEIDRFGIMKNGEECSDTSSCVKTSFYVKAFLYDCSNDKNDLADKYFSIILELQILKRVYAVYLKKGIVTPQWQGTGG